MRARACPLCGSGAFPVVLRLEGVPVDEGRLAHTAAEAARAPRGPVEIRHCSTCGMAYDAAPRVETVVYEPGYDTFLGHSPSFAAHVDETAAGLVERHGLAGGTVVDVACGRGDFMTALLDHGMAAGVGIDPAAHEPPEPRIRMVREHFAPALLPEDVALLSCRHMVYLLDDPVGFLRTVRDALAGRDTPVYLELMNQEATLRAPDPWDVTYEHRSYFTVESATRLLEVAGFEPLVVASRFHDRFIGVEARPRPRGADAPAGTRSSDLAGAVEGLQARAGGRVDEWRDALGSVRAAGGRIIAWCGGARAISFLALSGAGPEVVAVVDVSPSRQGRYLPVSARPIVAPGAVPSLSPDVVLVTNPAYTGEVRDELASMGLDGVPVVELDDRGAPAAIALAGSAVGRPSA